ncbi:DNA-binding response OmpR family regulator [Inquilinus ginsengisoli]|uniref:response regulator n=1 Tax=Inquilinus ginsengisoli TaxID=363840 RepID=UPI003D1EA1AA
MGRTDWNAKLLIVEDEWLLAEQIAGALTAAGFNVMPPVPSVATALSAIDHERVGAAVLDIRLNGEDSFELARELERRGIPFIFASGHVRAEIPGDLCGHPVLAKPIRVGELVETLQAVIAS